MSVVSLDTTDAELAELLQFIGDWPAADRGQLSVSLRRFTGSQVYDPGTLRADLARFAFLLGGSDGEDLL